jgi:hypothetical protein
MHLILIAAAGVVLILIASKVLSPGLDREIARVALGGELQPLLDAIAQRRAGARPDGYNRAIRRLWDAYQRERALPLVRALVEGHADSLIAQYWLEQLRTVEPELAASGLGEDFVARHRKAELAAACGPAG